MKNLHVKISDEEAKILENFSKAHGLNKSALIRILISHLEKNTDKEFKGEIKQYKRTERLYLILTDEEISKLESEAKRQGFTRTQYAYSILRQELLGSSLIPDIELNEIKEHNYLLRQIGTNLNQIARKLNTDWRHEKDIRVDEITKLYKLIVKEIKLSNEKIHLATNRHNRE